jgi:cytochrome b561
VELHATGVAAAVAAANPGENQDLMTDSQGRYAGVAIFHHWVMAALIVVVGVLGLLHDSWPRSTQAQWINIHAVIGLVVFVLLILRLAWRLRHRPPDLPPDVGEFSRRTSYPVHLLIYLLLFLIPVFGIVTFIWHGRVFDFGLFRVDPHVTRDRSIFHPTEDIHGYLAYALFALIVLHALAALWHHFVRRDRVLLRMWPGNRITREASGRPR